MLNELLDAMHPTTLVAMIADARESSAPSNVIDRLVRQLVSLIGSADTINELSAAGIPERYWPELED